MKNKIQVFAVLTILLVFPLLSWYYLKTGYDYQMDSRAELKDYGKLPAFNLVNINGGPYSNDSIGTALSVISFLGKDEKVNQKVITMLGKLNTQFGDNKNLKLLIAPLQYDSNSPNELLELYKKNNFDEVQHKLLIGDNSLVQKWVGKEIKVPKEWIPKENDAPDIRLEAMSDIEDYPFYVFVDRKQVIRNFYHVGKIKEAERMVEHIALLLPKEMKPDAIFVPEKEK